MEIKVTENGSKITTSRCEEGIKTDRGLLF